MKTSTKAGLAILMALTISACGEKSVKIGNQVWMAENLNDASKGGKCYEDKPENCEKYGRLYTWEEANKACPSGWHLPNNAEWEALVSFAGGEKTAGRKLKARSGWADGGGGTDEYGFSALPGAYDYWFGNFSNVGSRSSWWSTSSFWIMRYDNNLVYKPSSDKSALHSVRCVKD